MSLVSRAAPLGRRGTALGVYSTSQFLGAFVGGAGGGWLYGQFGVGTLFGVCGLVGLVWFVVTLSLQPPMHLLTRSINLGNIQGDAAGELSKRLAAIPGVTEAVVIVEEGMAYLRVDSRTFDRQAVDELTVPEQ